jgi:hypothetical protein
MQEGQGRAGMRARALRKVRPAKVSREEARRVLKGVTEIVSVEGYGVVGEKAAREPVTEKVEGLGDAVLVGDVGSVYEREW